MPHHPTDERSKSAIAAATRAVEYARRLVNSDDTKLEMLVEHLYTLSELRVEEGEFMRAESLLREAMFRIEDPQINRHKPRPNLAANVASSLGFLYDRWGKSSKAREWYGRSLSIAESAGFLDSDLGASVSNNLGMVEKSLENWDSAETHYRNAARIFELLRGAESSELAAVYNNLGALLHARERFDESLEAHEKALQIRQKLHDPISGKGMEDLRQSWQNMAAAYKGKGELEKAATLLRQAGVQAQSAEAPTPNWIVQDLRGSTSGLAADGGSRQHVERIPSDQPLARQGFKVEIFEN
jgi:tetratricopeptide (TPR) repeat protein